MPKGVYIALSGFRINKFLLVLRLINLSRINSKLLYSSLSTNLYKHDKYYLNIPELKITIYNPTG